MTTKIPVELSSTPGIVDGSNATAITIDSSENVGIGLTNPSDYYAKNLVVSGTNEGGITIASTGNHTNYLLFADSTSGVSRYAGMIGYAHNTDLMEFRTNSIQRMTIDSSGNVGIGISPSNTFSVGASGTVTTRYTSTDTSAFSLLQFENSGSIVLSADHGNSAANSNIIFKSDGATERMRIQSDGKISIGNDVPIWSGSYGGAVFLKGNNATAARNARLCIVDSTGAQDGDKEIILDNDGDLNIKGGDLIFNTAGKGIVLGATSNTAANTLDYYEEGTFTPALSISGDASGFGYAVQVGEYVRIGKLVTANVNIQLSSLGTATGTIQCNLPFSSDNTGSFTQVGVAILDNASTTAGAAGIQVGANSQTAALLTANTANNLAALTNTAQAANFRVRFSFTYKTQ